MNGSRLRYFLLGFGAAMALLPAIFWAAYSADARASAGQSHAAALPDGEIKARAARLGMVALSEMPESGGNARELTNAEIIARATELGMVFRGADAAPNGTGSGVSDAAGGGGADAAGGGDAGRAQNGVLNGVLDAVSRGGVSDAVGGSGAYFAGESGADATVNSCVSLDDPTDGVGVDISGVADIAGGSGADSTGESGAGATVNSCVSLDDPTDGAGVDKSGGESGAYVNCAGAPAQAAPEIRAPGSAVYESGTPSGAANPVFAAENAANPVFPAEDWMNPLFPAVTGAAHFSAAGISNGTCAGAPVKTVKNGPAAVGPTDGAPESGSSALGAKTPQTAENEHADGGFNSASNGSDANSSAARGAHGSAVDPREAANGSHPAAGGSSGSPSAPYAIDLGGSGEIYVTEGMSSYGIAKLLAEAGIIRNASEFSEYAAAQNRASSLRYGKYVIEKGLSAMQILAKLTHEAYTSAE
ncbi:MAG: hypothetical protein FWC55_00585 [Firmicutes bacterium]|nr:hypothetical protein [Bacillota bacterium]